MLMLDKGYKRFQFLHITWITPHLKIDGIGNTTYLAAMGNHDNGEAFPGWGYHESYEAIYERASRLGQPQRDPPTQLSPSS